MSLLVECEFFLFIFFVVVILPFFVHGIANQNRGFALLERTHTMGDFEGEQYYEGEGYSEGYAEGEGEGYAEGESYGEGEGYGEGYAEGEGEGEGYTEGEGYDGAGEGEGYCEGEQGEAAEGYEECEGSFEEAAPDAPEGTNPTDHIDVDYESAVHQHCRALFDFEPIGARELGFKEGEMLGVVDSTTNAEWWTAENETGHRGLVPYNYVELIEAPVTSASSSDPALNNKAKALARRDELVQAMREKEAKLEAAKQERILLEQELAKLQEQSKTTEESIEISQQICGDSFFYDLVRLGIELDLLSDLQSHLESNSENLHKDLEKLIVRLPMLRDTQVIGEFAKTLEPRLHTSGRQLTALEAGAPQCATAREQLRTMFIIARSSLKDPLTTTK